MNIKKKILKISLNAIPIIIMIALIPLIKNDYALTATYTIIIGISLAIHYEKKDIIFLIFGFIIMTIAETFFIATGVETFKRNTLLGIMPLWLPFLWAYGFVAIKRATTTILKK